MPTADQLPPICWDVDLYLDEPGSQPTVRWRGVRLSLDAGQEAQPLAQVCSAEGEVQTSLRPLRIVLDVDVLTVVGVLLGPSPDGALRATEAVVSISARPVVARPTRSPMTTSIWPLPPQAA